MSLGCVCVRVVVSCHVCSIFFCLVFSAFTFLYHPSNLTENQSDKQRKRKGKAKNFFLSFFRLDFLHQYIPEKLPKTKVCNGQENTDKKTFNFHWNLLPFFFNLSVLTILQWLSFHLVDLYFFTKLALKTMKQC